MKKAIIFTVILLSLVIYPALALSQPVLLRLPDTVIAEVVQKCLPFHVSQPSDTLAGQISVEKIENLEFKNDSLAALVTMRGKDVQLNTDIGGHQIRLNVGNVDLGFSLEAAVRFDKERQTLFIRPIVSDINQQGSQNKEVGDLIAALFNDQEIPLALDSLQPIITDIGTKMLIIDMSVDSVELSEKALNLMLTPKASVKVK